MKKIGVGSFGEIYKGLLQSIFWLWLCKIGIDLKRKAEIAIKLVKICAFVDNF